MILGMSTATFTLLHVVISLVGIGSGLVVMYGLCASKRLDRWTALFLVTTAATSLTGFAFPNKHLTPGIIVGILSMIVLAIAIPARYAFHMRGLWRPVYILSAALVLYFNVFVLVVQSFEKVSALHALAPTQKEPPFAITQLIVLVAFVVATVVAIRNFRLEATPVSASTPSEKRAA